MHDHDEHSTALPASLIYSSDTEPGIARRRYGRGFQYFLPDRNKVTAAGELRRIKSLGLPPAYRDVWICIDPNGHIQATGLDDAERKQYRYHDAWRAFRDQKKFDRLTEFAERLPMIRRRVAKILGEAAGSGSFSKEIAIAAVVRLVDRSAIRIGGRSRASKGATTLVGKNVVFNEGGIRLKYKAKGGKRVQCSLRDSRLQKILEQIDDLPGARLFQYMGNDGEVHPLDSGDVNRWLKDASGMDISAKIFRTWHGSVAALDAALETERPTVKLACEAAAAALRNTPAVCRKSYVHPAIIALLGDDPAPLAALRSEKPAGDTGLRQSEERLLGVIRAF